MKRFVIVVDIPAAPANARRTDRVAKVNEATLAAQAEVRAWLEEQGVPLSEFALDPPMAFGTFAATCTDRVAKLLRGAPGVQAVLEGRAW
jgi:hypothetical protein